jgi:hypothetical protein
LGPEQLLGWAAQIASPAITTGTNDRIVFKGHPVNPDVGQGPLQMVNGQWVLKGTWQMSLIQSKSYDTFFHSMIMFQQGTTAYAFGRVLRGFSDGNNTNYSGVIMTNLNLTDPAQNNKGDMKVLTNPYYQTTVTVTDPVIIGGEGYSWLISPLSSNISTSNCDTYAIAVWNLNVPSYQQFRSFYVGPLSANANYISINPYYWVYGQQPAAVVPVPQAPVTAP